MPFHIPLQCILLPLLSALLSDHQANLLLVPHVKPLHDRLCQHLVFLLCILLPAVILGSETIQHVFFCSSSEPSARLFLSVSSMSFNIPLQCILLHLLSALLCDHQADLLLVSHMNPLQDSLCHIPKCLQSIFSVRPPTEETLAESFLPTFFSPYTTSVIYSIIGIFSVTIKRTFYWSLI